jgi:hypothetical protein
MLHRHAGPIAEAFPVDDKLGDFARAVRGAALL